MKIIFLILLSSFLIISASESDQKLIELEAGSSIVIPPIKKDLEIKPYIVINQDDRFAFKVYTSNLPEKDMGDIYPPVWTAHKFHIFKTETDRPSATLTLEEDQTYLIFNQIDQNLFLYVYPKDLIPD